MDGEEELTLERVKRLRDLACKSHDEHKEACQRCQNEQYCDRSAELYCVAIKWIARVVQMMASGKEAS